MKSIVLFALLVGGLSLCVAASPSSRSSREIGIRSGSFTIGGQPAFLLGLSYYGALGAPEEAVRKDLDDARRYGFNWLRVWATWISSGENVSAVSTNGAACEPFMGRLRSLVTECDRRGLIVDVTLTRGEMLPSFAAHKAAVAALVESLKNNKNWYLDLANEHDIHDARFASDSELKELRELVRRLDPKRLVTASFGGHDLSREDVETALQKIGLDFLAPHRPRAANSPSETEAETCALRSLMRDLGLSAPILYQEPFRRGYSGWEPKLEDFLMDLRGAVAGGAAGWCFHNGQQANDPNKRPGRSFDLRRQRLFEQLDDAERQVVERVRAECRGWLPPR